jgi:hypothetical protein
MTSVALQTWILDDVGIPEDYDEWMRQEDARRKALSEERKRIFHLYTRTQEEIEADPDYYEEQL